MGFSNASQTRLGYIPEVTWGVTPATPAFKLFRYTSESLQHNLETGRSQEIRSDRNVTELHPLGEQAGGGLNFELIYGNCDDFLESLFYSTWTTNVLKNGIAEKSFTLEKTFEQGATDSFLRYTGMIVDSMTLTMAARQLINGSLSFMGKGGATDTAIIAGATYVAGGGPTNSLMSASVDFSGLAMTGVTPTPSIMSLECTFANNLRGRQVVGSSQLAGIGAGRFEVSGRASIYFEDLDVYNAWRAGTSSSLLFTLGTTTLQKYTVSIPKVKFETAQVQAGGNDQDVMVEATFVGLYDTGITATAQITRNVA